MKVKHNRALVLLLALGACNESSVDSMAEEAKLMQISRERSRVSGTDSLEKILSYWADDAVVMPPGQPPIIGKEAFKNTLKNASMPGFKFGGEPIRITLSRSGDMAIIIEKNQISVNELLGKATISIHKGVTIWRKERDGSWKNIVDTWNTDPYYSQGELESSCKIKPV